MDNHGFASSVGLKGVSIGPGDRIRLTYMNANSNHKCNSELINLLKEVLFHLMRCLALIDRPFNLWSEKV